MIRNLLVFNVILVSVIFILCQNPEVKRGRRPNRIDHLYCRQKNGGFGIKSSAVLNYSGDVCKTYCRVINRRNRTASFTEHLSPNNIRCGPFGARCIEGVCAPFGATGGSNAITEEVSKTRGGIPPINRIDANRRVRPGRRGTSPPLKTTSISTIEFTNYGEKEPESGTTAPIDSGEEETDIIRAKIIFPND